MTDSETVGAAVGAYGAIGVAWGVVYSYACRRLSRSRGERAAMALGLGHLLVGLVGAYTVLPDVFEDQEADGDE